MHDESHGVPVLNCSRNAECVVTSGLGQTLTRGPSPQFSLSRLHKGGRDARDAGRRHPADAHRHRLGRRRRKWRCQKHHRRSLLADRSDRVWRRAGDRAFGPDCSVALGSIGRHRNPLSTRGDGPSLVVPDYPIRIRCAKMANADQLQRCRTRWMGIVLHGRRFELPSSSTISAAG